MQIQILHAFTIQLQPGLDICIFGVARSRIFVPLLNLSCAFPIDLRKDRLERNAKNRALRSTPASPIGQWFRELKNLAGKFHSEKSINCRETGPVAKPVTTSAAPALQTIHNFVQ